MTDERKTPIERPWQCRNFTCPGYMTVEEAIEHHARSGHSVIQYTDDKTHNIEEVLT